MALTYMLDTNICSFIIRERPDAVIRKFEQVVSKQHRIVISAITYAELKIGASSPKASPRLMVMVDRLVDRFDGVLPWNRAAVDETVRVRRLLSAQGTPIGSNDAAIAGHALATGAILVSNNVREFMRVPALALEDWV
ncbi:MAG: type II toxin-antitoxin system VapC family toxin [Lautropia sp.]|nr:type II toxin-antitoxin system VapC family toxin [Lautropia sp.]